MVMVCRLKRGVMRRQPVTDIARPINTVKERTGMSSQLTHEEINQYKIILLDLLPQTGATIGNKAARLSLQNRVQEQHGRMITDDDYWEIRDALLSEKPRKIGIGRGQGGAIFLVDGADQPALATAGNMYKKEFDLYEPVLATINDSWVKNYRIKSFVSEITAKQGSKSTGGKWTRPDITLFAVRRYPFVPGKTIEVISFEIKPLDSFGIEGVFETASHSAFAHRSYLMVHASGKYHDSEVLDRLDSECERFGVGFLTFKDPTKWESYYNRKEAKHRSPDPYELSEFIQAQLSAEKQTLILTELLAT
jgi:hypothetical protein